MKKSTFGAALLLVGAAVGVARLQPRLAATMHAVKEREDINVLPPPAELHAATLGWDAAAVDLLWATLLVDYGTHAAEHREFLDTPKYVDAILELEPTYAPIYKYVDTMLAYRPLQGTEDDIRMARAYLERGTRERPQDAKLWLSYGQFVAFIGPSFLRDSADQEAWRRDGAKAIGHAVELGADAEGALTAASMLTSAGETKQAILFLERAYAFTEDSSMQELHDKIGRRLAALEATAMRDAADQIARAVNTRWKSELPFLTRNQYLLLGPKIDAHRCSGMKAAADPACARDWFNGLASPASSADSP